MISQPLLYGVIGFMFGAVISGFMVTRKPQSQPPAEPAMMMAGMNHDMGSMGAMNAQGATDHKSMTMQEMVDSLKGKTGDEFDSAFLSSMIEHHQGAVDMAKMATSAAKNSELQKLADDIILTQTKEIEQMKVWQQAWGYQSLN